MEKTKQILKPEEQRLLETMQGIYFGRIVNLEIKGGLPDISAKTNTVRAIKIGKRNGPPPGFFKQDFVLKDKQIEFLRYLRGLEDGVKVTVVVQHGLPDKMMVFGEGF